MDTMDTVIAASALVAFLACVAVVGMALGYNVELVYHPPILIKLKLTRSRQPEDQQVIQPNKPIPAPREPALPPEGESVDGNATPVSSDPNDG